MTRKAPKTPKKIAIRFAPNAAGITTTTYLTRNQVRQCIESLDRDILTELHFQKTNTQHKSALQPLAFVPVHRPAGTLTSADIHEAVINTQADWNKAYGKYSADEVLRTQASSRVQRRHIDIGDIEVLHMYGTITAQEAARLLVNNCPITAAYLQM